MTLLAGAVLTGWIAALPALFGRSGLSWRSDQCGAPGFRDPVTGQPAHLRTICRQAAAGPHP